MHSPRRTLAALLPALAPAASAAALPAQGARVVVDAAAVRGLETRLDSLSAALPPEQRQILSDLLLAIGSQAGRPRPPRRAGCRSSDPRRLCRLTIMR